MLYKVESPVMLPPARMLIAPEVDDALIPYEVVAVTLPTLIEVVPVAAEVRRPAAEPTILLESKMLIAPEPVDTRWTPLASPVTGVKMKSTLTLPLVLVMNTPSSAAPPVVLMVLDAPSMSRTSKVPWVIETPVAVTFVKNTAPTEMLPTWT